MKIYLAFGAAALLVLGGCKKDNLDPDGLVKATQDGKNTGDFLVDSKAFTPRTRVSTPGTNPVGGFWSHSRTYSTISVSLFRQDDDKRERFLVVALTGLRRPGAYVLSDLFSPYVVAGPTSYIVYARPTKTIAPRQYFVTSPQAPGYVVVTRIDTVARIISGTFEAKLRDYDGSDSVQVTKGRFDCTF